MALTEQEERILSKLGTELHDDYTFYHGMKFSLMDFEAILKTILDEAHEQCVRGKISKEVYRECKSMINHYLIVKKEEQTLTDFLNQPKQEMEQLLDQLLMKKKGIANAKVTKGRIVIGFDDGEMLDVQYEDHYGMNIQLGGVTHIDSDGL